MLALLAVLAHVRLCWEGAWESRPGREKVEEKEGERKEKGKGLGGRAGLFPVGRVGPRPLVLERCRKGGLGTRKIKSGRGREKERERDWALASCWPVLALAGPVCVWPRWPSVRRVGALFARAGLSCLGRSWHVLACVGLCLPLLIVVAALAPFPHSKILHTVCYGIPHI